MRAMRARTGCAAASGGEARVRPGVGQAQIDRRARQPVDDLDQRASFSTWGDWVDVAAPYHEFAGAFFKNAAEPRSPLSPFSGESAAAP